LHGGAFFGDKDRRPCIHYHFFNMPLILDGELDIMAG
jgi:hypothetical protein